VLFGRHKDSGGSSSVVVAIVKLVDDFVVRGEGLVGFVRRRFKFTIVATGSLKVVVGVCEEFGDAWVEVRNCEIIAFVGGMGGATLVDT
jgi:hypothetical protein